MEAKAGYSSMYKEYCEKVRMASYVCPSPAAANRARTLRWQTDIPNKNPDVCTNSLLKNLYGKKM
tara:strand:- start:666 stop:860 length:195 start_codon:yes stop_codon:yes gene_type:complete|eukprot:scaffold46095_cov74-Phaeocystis_antarctica.AAC.1